MKRHKLSTSQVEAIDRARELILPVALALQNLLDKFVDEEVGEADAFEAWSTDLSAAAKELDDIAEEFVEEEGWDG